MRISLAALLRHFTRDFFIALYLGLCFVTGFGYVLTPPAMAGLCGTSLTEQIFQSYKDIGVTIDEINNRLTELYLVRVIPEKTYGTYSAKRNEWYTKISILQDSVNLCRPSLLTDWGILDDRTQDFLVANLRLLKHEVTPESDPDRNFTDSFWQWDSTVNDPYASKQYYIRTLGFDQHIKDVSNSQIVVAVIDDGVYLNHDDLKQNLWRNLRDRVGDRADNDGNGYVDDSYGWNFISQSPEMTVLGSHGTSVAGIIGAAANNGIGIAGLGGNVAIMPLIACSSIGCPRSSVIEAIHYAVNNGARVINLSLGSILPPGIRTEV